MKPVRYTSTPNGTNHFRELYMRRRVRPWPSVPRGTIDAHVDANTGAVNRARWWVRDPDPFDASIVTYRLCARIVVDRGPPAIIVASRTFALAELERGVIPNVRDAIADQLRKVRRELSADIAMAYKNLRTYHADRFAT